ncbi:MAG: hypothetical protein H6Q04_3345 [Acidobacteria bacterium]|nr:hypothetical protein [Acidobacteriota bacterium]
MAETGFAFFNTSWVDIGKIARMVLSNQLPRAKRVVADKGVAIALIQGRLGAPALPVVPVLAKHFLLWDF